MKNETLMKFTLSSELLKLLGIQESEIVDYRLGYIYFERNNRKLLIVINSNYYNEHKDGENYITLDLYDTSYTLSMSYGLKLFHITKIKNEEDFGKFRKFLQIELLEPKIIDCSDETNKD